MRVEYRFTCSLRNGLHARPASMLAEVLGRFESRFSIVKVGGDGPVDAKSVLSIVGLDVKLGEECLVVAEGNDASAAVAALATLVEERLEEGDEVVVQIAEDAGPVVRLPIGLRRLRAQHVAGRSVCAGIGIGGAVLVEGLVLPASARNARAQSVAKEFESAERAVAQVREELRRRAAGAGSRLESELMRAHAEIAGDPAVWGEIKKRIGGGATAAQAVVGAGECFAERLRGASAAYIRDRVVDVQDVCMQLVERLLGGNGSPVSIELERDSVVFAEVLTANQLLRMDRAKLKGLVLGRVGATSHTVILARSLRIPTIIDVPDARSAARAGERVVVDAEGGFVIASVSDDVERYYERERATRRRRAERLAPIALQHAVTLDGSRLEIGANASTPAEVSGAVADGAEGVGLLRTELLFLDRSDAPTEEEQFEAYAGVVDAARGGPVIIRAFDIGGDKPAAYLRMAREENPFLGVRGLRLYAKHPGLLRSQLRAILRASARGPVKIMAPMVATPAEAAWFRDQVRQVQTELSRQGVAFDRNAPVGVMIEIPACAMAMEGLCAGADFFSIGTNDLCQYFMAVDRGNAGVATLYNPRNPAFLRLLRTIVDGAHAGGRWIGVCGEMAGDRRHLPLMVGLGVDEISVSPGEVLKLKAAVRGLNAARCRQIARQAESCKDAVEVESLLKEVESPSGAPEKLIDVELIEVGLSAPTKEDAIRALVDLLYVVGRTERPREVEDAVWAREETYSTGLGYGFAVPHCKTDAVRSPTLAVARLASPVEWGSMDGAPVQTVMLLAIPASDTTGAHMKVFAKLARKLMHEDFRDRISRADSPGAIVERLRTELGLDP